MVETLDELSYDVEEDGVLVRRQIDRVVVARGAWATLMFLYEELDRATGSFRAPKIAVARFKKFRGAYRRHSVFTLASVAEARALTDVFERWFEKMDATANDGEANDDEANDGEANDGEANNADALDDEASDHARAARADDADAADAFSARDGARA
jgi:hypothetical protein